MALSPRDISEARKVYETYWESYFTGNIEAFAACIDENFSIIGTSEGETASGKEAVAAMYEAQFDEVVGKAEVRNRQVREIPTGDMLQIIEFSDIYVLIDSEWSFYSKFRLSALLHQTPDGWKLLQQHGSLPDMRVGEGETMAIDKISKENLELRDAVKRRTAELESKNRALEIEAALERVRAVAMGMNKPEDMLVVCREIAAQLQLFGVDRIRNVQTAIIDAEIGQYLCYQYFAPYDRDVVETTEYLKSPVEHELVKQMMASQDAYFINSLTGNELDTYSAHRKAENYLPDPLLDEATEVHYCYLSIGEGGLGLTLYTAFNEDVLHLFRRFHQVFSLAYRRFRDIQKATAQAREARIETALEKVRSRSLAMHKSDELNEVVAVLFEKLKDLQIPFTAIGIATRIEGSKDLNAFVCGQNEAGLVITNYRLPYFDNPVPKDLYSAIEEQLDYFVGHYSKEEKDSFYEYVIEHTAEFRHLPEDIKRMIFDSTTYTISMVAVKNAVFNVNDFDGKVLAEHEVDILKRFARVFDQAYTRFLDLQKAEAQVREAQIEASLERIRSSAMAMHQSDELPDMLSVLFDQFDILGINPSFTHLTLFDEINETFSFRMSGRAGHRVLVEQIHDINRLEAWKIAFEHWKNGDPNTISCIDYPPEVLPMIFDIIGPILSAMPEESRVRIEDFPNGLYTVQGHCKFGYLGFHHNRSATEEEKNIVVRFAGEFGRVYQRFLDLQKAEAQTREAKIEAALEKVRSRTMGMQGSDELADVANVLFAEMNGLVHNLWTCGFVLCEKDRAEDEWWLSLEDGFSRGFFLPNVNDYAHATLYQGWLEEDTFRAVQLDGDKLQEHYDWLMQIPVAKNIFDEMEAAGMQRPEWQKLHAAYFSKGYLVIITREPCPEEEIFKRFATVFDQTYTRFLDLKRAEAQARESQIEAALEKVRSRSLAMQSPDELIEVAQLLREEMGALGVEELETSSIYILDENTGNTQCWFTIKDSDSDKAVTDQMTLNLQDTWVGQEMHTFYRSKAKQTSIRMQGEQRVEWIRYCGEKSNVFTPEGFYGTTIPERTYHLYKFSNGYIGAASPGEISSESWDLLKRATSVFSFAYTRFRDLQKAETRAREARIELALERIRAQVASMQESSDLFDIVVGMRTEFLALGHEADYFWHMRWLPDSYEMSMTSEDGSRIGMVISLPKFVHDEIPALAEWEKGDDPIYVLALDPDGAWDYIENMNTHGDYELADPNAPGKEDIEHIGGLTFIIARTTHGEIGYSRPGMVPEPPKDALETLVRFAGVFDLAYKRFEDLKASERQALMIREERDRLEIALNELRATQAQLVQQEKLASLGQLTAGIAHEIKNPLNFVNNFSEVSVELIDEALEEIEKLEHSDVKEEIIEILNDVKGNLVKVHAHGTRADSIVKSMLQHSRGGSGKMEPTDLNALIKEYINLSFHGMRAGKNPINVDIQLNLDEKIGKVNLISEDFSRVLLNICNNAFDAMREKAKTETDYLPILSVKTERTTNDELRIAISDNGPGIPESIKDKILQPFFTTKKGTEGTGLGLSITNDIIKAHGGEFQVKTEGLEGTTFIIQIPITD